MQHPSAKWKTFCLGISLTLAFVSMLGCDDDSTTTPVQGDPGVYGEMADSLDAVLEQTVRGHANVNASLEYFTPHIAVILNPEAVLASSVGSIGCIPDDTRGMVYQYNGHEYVGTPAPESSNNAIFVLYALDTSGAPKISDVIGEISYNCSEQDSYRSFYIRYHTADRWPIMLHGSTMPYGLLIDGSIYPPSGSMAIVVSGLYKPGDTPGSTSLGLGFAFWDQAHTERPDLSNAAFQEDFLSDGSCQVQTSFYGYRGGNFAWTMGSPPWRFSVKLSGDAKGDVTGGYATYYGYDTISGLSACVRSGTVAGPWFTSPSTNCLPDTDLLSVNSAELHAMRRIYGGLYELRAAFDRFLAPIRPLIKIDS